MGAELSQCFSQATYLEVCEHWVNQAGMAGDWGESTRAEAVGFATLRGGRSGRTAWQFAAHWVGRKPWRKNVSAEALAVHLRPR